MKIVPKDKVSPTKAKKSIDKKEKAVESKTEELNSIVRDQMRESGMSEEEIEKTLVADAERSKNFDELYSEIESKFPNESRFDQHDKPKPSYFMDECIRQLKDMLVVPDTVPDRLKEVAKVFEGKFFTRNDVFAKFLVKPEDIMKDLEFHVELGVVAVEYIQGKKYFGFPSPFYMLSMMKRRVEFYHVSLQMIEHYKALLTDQCLLLEVAEAGHYLWMRKVEEEKISRIKKEDGSEEESNAKD